MAQVGYRLIVFSLSLVLLSCGIWPKKVEESPTKVGDREIAQAIYDDLLEDILELMKKDGWIELGCDAMIWNAEAGVVVEGIDILAAEDEPGRFNRRPEPFCYYQDRDDQESATRWSRDMFVAGLLQWALLGGHLDVLERHAGYGKAENWVMNIPIADGRVIYTPQVIGLLYQAIYALGGENNLNRLWPSVYPKDLDDYHAHLQVKSIWLRGRIARMIGDLEDVPKEPEGDVVEISSEDAVALGLVPMAMDSVLITLVDDSFRLLSISETMYVRLREHVERVPEDPFYQYVLGLYSGDMSNAISVLSDGTTGGYVRCSDDDVCRKAHRLFVAHLILEALE